MSNSSDQSIFQNPVSVGKDILDSETSVSGKVLLKVQPDGKLDCDSLINKENNEKNGKSKTYICKYCCCRCDSPITLQNHIASHGENPKHICHICDHNSSTFLSLMTHFLENLDSHKYDKLPIFCSHNTSSNICEVTPSEESLSFKNSNHLQANDCKPAFQGNPVRSIKFQSFESTSAKDVQKMHSHYLPVTRKLDSSHSSSQLSRTVNQNRYINQRTKYKEYIEAEFSNTLSSDVSQDTYKIWPFEKKGSHILPKLGTKDTENCKDKDNQFVLGVVDNTEMCEKLHLTCSMCFMNFKCKKNLLRHEKMHTEKPSHMCRFCGKPFHRKDTHNRHEKTVHQTNTSELHCYCCGDVFFSSPLLINHVMSVHGQHKIGSHYKIPCSVKNKKIYVKDFKTQCILPSKLHKKTNAFSNLSSIQNTALSVKSNDELFSFGDENKKSHNSGYGSNISITYKCTDCLEIFNSFQQIFEHFQSVHNISLESSKNKIENSQSHSDNCESNHSVTKGSRSFISSDQQFENFTNTNVNVCNDSSELNCLNEISCDHSNRNECEFSFPKEVEKPTSDDLLNNESKDISEKVPKKDDEKMEITSFVKSIENTMPFTSETKSIDNVVLSSDNTCLLCLESFSSQTNIPSHQQLPHKMIGLYYCSRCKKYGSKDIVAKHMLSHMQEIGAFVVLSNEQNFDNISYSPLIAKNSDSLY